MKLHIALVATLLAATTCCLGQSAGTSPEKTQNLVATALSNAASADKNVMVIFHASWCSWCKKLEAVLDKPDVHSTMDKYYVVVRLDVLERGDKKVLENPGGGEYMKELGGEKSGLPFYAFLNAKGEKLADSNVMPESSNIGYPGSKEESAAFAGLLKKTAPKMTEEELSGVMKYFGK
jgi:thiol:disulfide interchange protein